MPDSETPEMRSRRENPVQLELGFNGKYALRTAIGEHLARSTFGLREATIHDYNERAEWILREFGEHSDIREIRLKDLEHVVDRWRGLIRNVTIKKRLTFLRAALQLAEEDGLIDRTPKLPKLMSDGQAKDGFHTVEQWRVFRGYLPPGPFRRFYDFGFWTSHRAADIFATQRWMLDPDRAVVDNNGETVCFGSYFRRTQKTKKHKIAEIWLPAQPEFREVMREILEAPGIDSDLIIPPLWNVRRTFCMAASRAIADGWTDIPATLSPNDLRRSFTTMLNERGYTREQIRVFLGHKGSLPADWRPGHATLADKPAVTELHYMRPSPTMVARKGPQRVPVDAPGLADAPIRRRPSKN